MKGMHRKDTICAGKERLKLIWFVCLSVLGCKTTVSKYLFTFSSVTILSEAMTLYKNRPDELDQAVRRQLGCWFLDYQSDIMDKWELKKIFYVRKYNWQ